MLSAMHHRGPDDRGIFDDSIITLGTARLAILDTSPAGHQPMSNSNQSIWIAYNGEVYNFQEERAILQQKGYSFQSDTDTEVVLKMYEEYGDDFALRMRGMFAVAIYDKRNSPKERLVLARDQLGIKPLLYHRRGPLLVFASEMKSLLSSGLIDRQFDPEALRLLLTYGSITQPLTAIKGVRMLPPGHRLIIESNVERLEKYWQLNIEKADEFKNKPYDELVKMVRRKLEESVKMQMISDVPIGAFLSGGVDSAVLVALMAKSIGGKVKTFSVGFEAEGKAIDETDASKKIANHIGTDHSRVVVTGQEVRNKIKHIVASLDQPSVDGINSYFVAQAAKPAVTVSISGTGGDELFAGYPWFINMLRYHHRNLNPIYRLMVQIIANVAQLKIFNYLPVGKPLRAIGKLRGWSGFLHKFAREYQVLGTEGAAAILSPQFGQDAQIYRDPVEDISLADELPRGSVIQRVSALTLRSYTQNQLLRDIDATSMAHSLEVRVPYLDTELVNLILALPDNTKLSDKSYLINPALATYRQTGAKRILIDAVRDLLPDDIDLQKKSGFGMPFTAWLKGPLRDILDDALSPATVIQRGFFKPQKVTQLKNNFLQGRAHWSAVWILMITELWCREILDNYPTGLSRK